jgi:hypothetical protein
MFSCCISSVLLYASSPVKLGYDVSLFSGHTVTSVLGCDSNPHFQTFSYVSIISWFEYLPNLRVVFNDAVIHWDYIASVMNEWAWSTGGMPLDGEKRSIRWQDCPSAPLSITNSTWTGLGLNPGMRGESPTSKHMNHGTAVFSFITTLAAMYCDIHKEGNHRMCACSMVIRMTLWHCFKNYFCVKLRSRDLCTPDVTNAFCWYIPRFNCCIISKNRVQLLISSVISK